MSRKQQKSDLRSAPLFLAGEITSQSILLERVALEILCGALKKSGMRRDQLARFW